MSIFQNFFKPDSFAKVIGNIECTGESLPNMLIGMMSSMGMANPASLPSKSSKGVRVTKKGKNSYKLTLGMFNPPVDIMWTGPLDEKQILDLVSKIIEDNKTLSYVNYHNIDGKRLFQFAISY